jgi:hypothetical protein
MRRREVLKAAAVGTGLWAAGPCALSANEPAATGEETDVLVIGGGTAGTIAAIQAGRTGVRTMLVEMGGQLGGTTTTGGVSFPGLFHAWGKQIIAGIGWELVQQAVALDSGTLPDFTAAAPPGKHWQQQVRVNGPLYAALAEEAVLAAGVQLGYYEFPLAVERTSSGWRADLAGKGQRRRVRCRQLIDCTGGADVVGLLGLARLREETTQPGTMMFELDNYDVKQLDARLIQRRYEEALRAGRLKPGDYAKPHGQFIHLLASKGANAQHVFGADSSTSATKTRANIAGRSSVLRLLRFIRTLPGCERARLARMMTETAVRETYRIVGETLITVADYTSGRRFDDAVCHAFYPVDLHDEQGVKPEPLKPGTVPTIPLRALVPKSSHNLLVAGRSVSSDRLANSALRVQASCMAMGQAAGAAAALAVQGPCEPRDVPLRKLKDLLVQHGAIVP